MDLTLLDLALIGGMIYSLYVGWRRGLIMTITSIFGVVLGVWIANTTLEVAYGASNSIDGKRITITTVVFLAGIVIGSAFGAIVGSFIQRIIARGPLKLANKLSGSAFSFLTWNLVIWLITSYLIALPVSKITSAINSSIVIAKIDAAAPDNLRSYIDAARSYIINSQLPEVAIDVIVGPEVQEPDPAILANPQIATAIASVVRVESISEECNTKLSGSGFVIGENLVATNAHVIAGITEPNIRVGGKGKSVPGVVIYFDPTIDLALIRTKNLTAPALSIGEDLRRSDMAVVAGFPGGGSLTLMPARVKALANSVDSDIYGKGQVTRELYVLRADVKQGDSGAPLINESGQVSGVIFAASATESMIGYALTNTHLIKALEISKSQTEPVKTGNCLPAN